MLQCPGERLKPSWSAGFGSRESPALGPVGCRGSSPWSTQLACAYHPEKDGLGREALARQRHVEAIIPALTVEAPAIAGGFGRPIASTVRASMAPLSISRVLVLSTLSSGRWRKRNDGGRAGAGRRIGKLEDIGAVEAQRERCILGADRRIQMPSDDGLLLIKDRRIGDLSASVSNRPEVIVAIDKGREVVPAWPTRDRAGHVRRLSAF